MTNQYQQSKIATLRTRCVMDRNQVNSFDSSFILLKQAQYTKYTCEYQSRRDDKAGLFHIDNLELQALVKRKLRKFKCQITMGYRETSTAETAH